MGKTNFVIGQLKKVSVIFIGFFLSILMFHGCAQQSHMLSASQYRFNIEDETYRIRSIFYDDESEAYNELIGQNFMAVDFDQDRVIDCILLGEVSLNEAQKIYEYGLGEVVRENRLQVKVPSIDRYVYENSEFHCEIRSFRPTNVPPFNQFQMIDKHQLVSPQVNIMVDQNADGTLDEVLKGGIALDHAQSRYADVIETGLQRHELVKVNDRILVRER